MTSEPAVPPGEDPDADQASDPSTAMTARPPGMTDPAAPPAESPGPSITIPEHRLHPAATAIKAIEYARSIGFGAIALLVAAGLVRGLMIIGVLVVVAGVYSLLEWRATRYTVIDGALHMRTGVFSHNEQVIPATRISALDTSRGLLQRIFGVVAVQIQLAGGARGKAELKLAAVSFPDAEALRSALGHRDDGETAKGLQATTDEHQTTSTPRFLNPTAHVNSAPVVYQMSPRELLVSAVTAPAIAVVFAGLAAAFSFPQDALPDSAQNGVENYLDSVSVTVGILLLAAAVVIAALISVVGTVLLYARFTVTRDDKRIRVRRGLITEHVATIPTDRIHGVRIVEGLLRQPLGYAAVEVEVAGYAGSPEVTRTLIPLVRRSEIPALLAVVVPQFAWPDQPLEQVPAKARRRYLTAPLVLSLLVVVPLLVAPIGLLRLLALVPPVLALAYGRRCAGDAGWQLHDGTLVLRWRTLARSTLLAQTAKLQRSEQSANPLQRRAKLASFRVRLSNAREGRVRHLEQSVVHELLTRTVR